MTIKTIQDEILQMKKEQDLCILAHSYQAHEILEVADFTGDSYQLSVMAKQAPQSKILMCGVRFMAETVKILSPEKTVYLSNPSAGCPMAEQMDKSTVKDWKKRHPEGIVVAYINTTAELKTVCDVCVTSSSALKIVEQLDNRRILFIPDCNLGQYIASKLPGKNITLLEGCCPIHASVSRGEARIAKKAHPGAELLVHPECLPEVASYADFVGSTSAIMDYAKQSAKKEFIIGTEISIAEHLQYECPDKSFYPMSSKLICPDMKITTLMDVHHILSGKGGEEITMAEETRLAAKHCIDEMIRLG